MAYVITEPCIGTKDSACVDVCPVDCIHPRKDEATFEAAEQLYIHPTSASIAAPAFRPARWRRSSRLDEVPDKWKHFNQKNTEYYQK